jgi:hypothetical protein
VGQDTMIEFKSGSPKLTPDILGADAAVLTIKEFKRNVKTRIGDANVIIFEEFPDHGWYANTTSLKAVAAVYGPDFSKWPKKQIPVEVRDSSVVGSGKGTRTVWAAGAQLNEAFNRSAWDKAVKGAKKLARK